MKKLKEMFEEYYIAWNIKYGIKHYPNQVNYEKISKEIIKIKDIHEILDYFEKSMYLDLWVQICDKDKNFFIQKVLQYQGSIISSISEEIHYLGEKDVIGFIHSNVGDFENKIDIETNEIVGKMVTKVKSSKNLLLIIQKLDTNLYNEFIYEINKRINKIGENKEQILFLWNCIEVEKDGSSCIKDMDILNQYIIDNKDHIDKEELSMFCDYLEMAKIKGIDKIKSTITELGLI